MKTAPETRLEALAEQVMRKLSVKMSRRAVIDRLGKQAIAVSVGGAGVAILASPAYAHVGGGCGSCQGSCCGPDSVWCSTLTGVNACPSGSVGCGSWIAGTCAGGATLRYADCCGGCNNGASCTCIGGAPSCCRHQVHHNGAIDDCSTQHIKCRRSFCS